MLRTVVIGLGGRGMVWARAVRAHDACTLSGLIEVDPDLLARRAKEMEMPESGCFPEWAPSLSAADLAVVVTPHAHHYAAVRDVLCADMHCLVEKPFTLRLEEAQELVALAEERKRVLVVGQNYRFKPECRFVEQAVREQRLGRLGNVEGSFHRHRPPRRPNEVSMPWPLLFTQVIHHLDWLHAVLPAPVRETRAFHQRLPWSDWQNPSACRILLHCEDDVLVSYSGSYESRGQISSHNGRWRFECEKGDIVVDEPPDAVWFVTGENQERTLVFEPPAGARSSELILLDHVREAVEHGTEPPTSGRRNLAALSVLFDLMRV